MIKFSWQLTLIGITATLINMFIAQYTSKKMLEFKENEKMKNRYLTAILNNTDCGMIYTDYEGKIGHYNLMGNKLFNDKVYINNSIFDLIHEIDKNFIFKLKNSL